MKFGDFCTYCAAMMGTDTWPRQCPACKQFMYRNPTPVGVGVIPIIRNDVPGRPYGLLVIRRDIEPEKGKLALPGGFMELGETWEQAIARETDEETGGGVMLEPTGIKPFHVETATNGNLLIFGIAAHYPYEAIRFRPNNEVQEWDVLWRPEQLAFPTHTKVAEHFFELFAPAA